MRSALFWFSVSLFLSPVIVGFHPCVSVFWSVPAALILHHPDDIPSITLHRYVFFCYVNDFHHTHTRNNAVVKYANISAPQWRIGHKTYPFMYTTVPSAATFAHAMLQAIVLTCYFKSRVQRATDLLAIWWGDSKRFTFDLDRATRARLKQKDFAK